MFSNSSAGDFSLPTRYVMVAASRSGSTCAVMRLSSPICSTLSSQASRSLAFGARSRASDASAVVAPPSGLMVTFMSMIWLSARPEASFDRQIRILDHLAPACRLVLDERGEFLRRALDRLEEVRREELLLEGGIGD